MNGSERTIVRQVLLGPMGNYVYLLGSPSTREAAVIDPGWEPDKIVAAATSENLTITKILVTHAHPDHIGALDGLLQRVDADVYVHEHELLETQEMAPDAIAVTDNEEIELADLSIQCLHTPGHTLGSQCFLVEDCLFTGDTLFVGACGRCDFPNSDPRAFYSSLQRLAELDGSIRVMSGHAYGPTPVSTIADERANNPYLRVPDIESWLHMFGL